MVPILSNNSVIFLNFSIAGKESVPHNKVSGAIFSGGGGLNLADLQMGKEDCSINKYTPCAEKIF